MWAFIAGGAHELFFCFLDDCFSLVDFKKSVHFLFTAKEKKLSADRHMASAWWLMSISKNSWTEMQRKWLMVSFIFLLQQRNYLKMKREEVPSRDNRACDWTVTNRSPQKEDAASNERKLFDWLVMSCDGTLVQSFHILFYVKCTMMYLLELWSRLSRVISLFPGCTDDCATWGRWYHQQRIGSAWQSQGNHGFF